MKNFQTNFFYFLLQITIKQIYDYQELQNILAEKEHSLLESKLSLESLQNNYKALEGQLQDKSRQYSELEAHIKKLTTEQEAQIQKLTNEHQKLKADLEKSQTMLRESQKSWQEEKALLAETRETASASSAEGDDKIKAIETQREALRDALRSQRERKDHEIKQLVDRVKNLEMKLDKEKSLNSQMQQKLLSVNTTNPKRSTSTPTSLNFPESNGSVDSVGTFNGLANSSNILSHATSFSSINQALPSPTAESSFNLGMPRRRMLKHNGSFYNLNNTNSSLSVVDDDNSTTSLNDASDHLSASQSNKTTNARSHSPAPLILGRNSPTLSTISTSSSSNGDNTKLLIQDASAWMEATRPHSPVPSIGTMFSGKHLPQLSTSSSSGSISGSISSNNGSSNLQSGVVSNTNKNHGYNNTSSQLPLALGK